LMPSATFMRWGGLASMVGSALWALTPLRQPLLGGELPGHPVFQPYNLVLVIISVLLTLGLLALRSRYQHRYGRLGAVGDFTVLVGYALQLLGSLPALVLPADRLAVVMAGQDLGFLGALVAGVGALPLGIALWRANVASRTGAVLLILALPVGFAGTLLISASGFAEVAGLPFTALYGGAWLLLGRDLWSQREPMNAEVKP
jgi:hypothetical protein